MRTFFKSFILLSISMLIISCTMLDEPKQEQFRATTALSIFVNNGQVGISSLVNENGFISTEYWIGGTKTDAQKLTELLPNGNYFKTSVNGSYRASTIFKNLNGETAIYQFPRNYNLHPDNQLYCLKGSEVIRMDTATFGAIHAVDASLEEVFSGFFFEGKNNEYGTYLSPKSAFVWDGKDKITELPLPNTDFAGLSCIHKSGEDIYVGGRTNFTMYWKNQEIVKLHDKYGVVNQIKTIGDKVYAAGFYNKNNYKNQNHTACYWIDDTLIELEDNAIAYSIFLIGEDVYVAGACGKFETEYKACYWKNGEKVMLEE